ncbi:hypothetical protein E2C01_038638 [Portunus trituberculatus]|uniref:Uncharacterized protein n=1 Tax=Portunus trituberculatus TaxID=210409 RepID=A0A5B7FHQ3_PORTR|nr:hypothetical protein [Portunus trituberculatus]
MKVEEKSGVQRRGGGSVVGGRTWPSPEPEFKSFLELVIVKATSNCTWELCLRFYKNVALESNLFYHRQGLTN